MGAVSRRSSESPDTNRRDLRRDEAWVYVNRNVSRGWVGMDVVIYSGWLHLTVPGCQ